jgi:hypothetical protein
MRGVSSHLTGVSGWVASTGISGLPPYCGLSLAAAGPGLFHGGGGARVRWRGLAGGGGRVEDDQVLGEAIGVEAGVLPASPGDGAQIHPVPLGRRVRRCSGWREWRPATLLLGRCFMTAAQSLPTEQSHCEQCCRTCLGSI